MHKFLWFSLLLLAGPGSAPAAETLTAEGTAFFEQKIRPLLVEHCYECHSAQAKKLKGNLYLDTRAGWEKGGDSGEPALRPGQPEESLLIQSVRHDDPDAAMPPKKPRLPDAAIADLVTWVKMGAPDPRQASLTGAAEAKRADKTWWSLQPIAQEFRHGSIDEFLQAKLAEKGLGFGPQAEPRALIRRMTYDLTGLPPSPAEVEAFVAACAVESKTAIEALVDRLLASPRYGEQWGRHWLDVVRFGESIGFERNLLIDDLWPFRDYVIRSFNEDKPMDRFITEHLAGDVVGAGDPSVEVGSAFLVAGPFDNVINQDIVAQKNIRAATLDDMITATGSAFLGLTINCARCHNHKFDPIPTEDYYRLRAAFEGVEHGLRVVASPAERAAHDAARKPLEAEKARLTAEKQALESDWNKRAAEALKARRFPRPKINPLTIEETFTPVPARLVKFVIRATTRDPLSSKGAGLTEFQVWTGGDKPQNVALASAGAVAAGAKGANAEDFPDAYGPQFCIDGKFGEHWVVGTPAELVVTLPGEQRIERIVASTAQEGVQDYKQSRVVAPSVYEVLVSLDGVQWRKVASNDGREPWDRAHGIAMMRAETGSPEEQEKIRALAEDLESVEKRLQAVPKLRELWVGKHSKPQPTWVHKGGDPMKPGGAVVPASLNVLDRVTKPFSLPAEATEAERRVALAQWIVAGDNPLTPRVLANRVWHYHFGTGLVDTPSDFGFMGSRPTHPELLDYLARRLMAGGWKLKPLHREILLSRAYLQSAATRADAARLDKESRLLWRYPPRRLRAEEVRDTLLAVAGRLRLEPMGGPGFQLYKYTSNNVSTYFPLDQHGADTYRRAVYHQNARASVVDVLSDFDLPDIAFAAPKRANTTTPLQALTLWNHRFTLDMASALAERIAGPAPVASAYALAYQRAPSPKEAAEGARFIAAHGLPAFCRALLNSNELLYTE